MKRKALITTAAAVALVAVVGIGSTLAYFTDRTEEKDNVVTFGHVDITLNEDATGDDKAETVDNGIEYSDVLPGDTVIKDVTVSKNADSADCFVRVKVEVTPSDTSDAKYVADVKALEKALRDQVGYHWQYNEEDGYYYYTESLIDDAADTKTFDESVTSPLWAFETRDAEYNTVDVHGFKIPTSWGNEAADKSFTISITAEAIQADNFEGTWPKTVEEYNATTTTEE